MQKRTFGRTGIEVSTLGFGIMRMPVIDDDAGQIDEAKAVPMVRYAIDNGVNYLDTAYVYHKEQSEVFLGKLLKEANLRNKVYIATKNPVYKAEEHEDFDRFLNEELRRLQTDYIDFYLLHALNKNTWKKTRELGVLDFLERALKDGRIRYAGFSFHDDLDTFKDIVDGYDWTFGQIQYNYMDEEYQAGTEGLKYAHDKGLAVVIMEPLRGGRLTNNVPERVQKIWDQADIERTPAEWGLRWVCDHAEVATVLSGMSTMEHVVENVNTAANAYPNTLNEKEMAIIGEVRDAYRELIKINCTGCKYCVPCPQEIPIPNLFTMYNEAFMYHPFEKVAENYVKRIVENNKHVEVCADCVQCEDVCPQNLPVREHLRELHDAFMAHAKDAKASD